jgi:hypothetical protein
VASPVCAEVVPVNVPTPRIGIAGAVERGLGCGLQRDGGIVLLQPRRPSR